MALGDQTVPVYGRLDGRKIFCGAIEESSECLANANAKANGARKRILWLGNSQLHAINQYHPGEETAPVLLSRRLAADDAQVMAFSMPNASFSELLLITFVYLRPLEQFIYFQF